MDPASSGAPVQGRDVAVLGGLRTPWAKAGTALKDVHASELGRATAEELLLRLGVSFDQVEEVIFGNVAQPADSANIARVIALRLGLRTETPACTVQRNCASAMEAVTQAFDKIRFGQRDLVLAGGIESMSNIPLLFPESYGRKLVRVMRSRSLLQKAAAFGSFRPADIKPVIAIEVGLTDPVCGQNMGETAENLAREFGIGRAQQDAFALESHRRAIRALDKGFFAEEILTMHPPPSFAALEQDVGPRREQTSEALAKLRPYFDRRFGTVTVGNACPITDGGCSLVLASAEKAESLGIEPLGWIRSYSYKGCAPDRMGLGPAFATPDALAKANLSLADIDRVELNEAFAAQVLANKYAFESEDFARHELGRDEPIGELDLGRVNVNGGAIALGHPVGATGARLILTLLRELDKSGLERGVATLCIGGGQGGAVVVERHRR